VRSPRQSSRTCGPQSTSIGSCFFLNLFLLLLEEVDSFELRLASQFCQYRLVNRRCREIERFEFLQASQGANALGSDRGVQRPRARRFGKVAREPRPASLTLVRACSASTIKSAIGARAAKVWSVQRSGRN